jgi:hypothetical protein
VKRFGLETKAMRNVECGIKWSGGRASYCAFGIPVLA